MVIGFLFHSLPFVWGAFMVGIMSSCVVALVFCKCKILEKQIRQWQLRIIKENNIVTLNDVFTLKNIIRRSLDNVVFLLCKSKSENEKKHYIEQYQIINKKRNYYVTLNYVFLYNIKGENL